MVAGLLCPPTMPRDGPWLRTDCDSVWWRPNIWLTLLTLPSHIILPGPLINHRLLHYWTLNSLMSYPLSPSILRGLRLRNSIPEQKSLFVLILNHIWHLNIKCLLDTLFHCFIGLPSKMYMWRFTVDICINIPLVYSLLGPLFFQVKCYTRMLRFLIDSMSRFLTHEKLVFSAPSVIRAETTLFVNWGYSVKSTWSSI